MVSGLSTKYWIGLLATQLLKVGFKGKQLRKCQNAKIAKCQNEGKN
jgi:hypothetical protein